jgi:hypothetical protein
LSKASAPSSFTRARSTDWFLKTAVKLPLQTDLKDAAMIKRIVAASLSFWHWFWFIETEINWRLAKGDICFPKKRSFT